MHALQELCGCKKKDHHASSGASNKRKPRLGVKAIFDTLLRDDDEAEELLESANREAKAGLKSKNKMQKSKKNKKVDSDEADEKKKRRNKVFRLGLLFMDVRGTSKMTVEGSKKALKLKSSALPSHREIVEAIQRGHAVRFSAGLEMPEDATFEKVNRIIRQHLPKPFEYLDRTWEQPYSPYVFACKEKRKLALCQHLLEPTGQDIQDISRATAGRSFESNCLYIVTRKPIPEDILASWSPSSIADVEDSDDRSQSNRATELPESEGEGSETLKISKKYHRRVVDSDAEAAEGSISDQGSEGGGNTSDESRVLRPRKKARLDTVDLTEEVDSDDFEMSMVEYNAVHGEGSDSAGSSLFLPGTPPSRSTPSTPLVNPQYSDPRPDNDPYTNKPDLDF
ncbi:hypothetical protein PM082_018346 [Marasmius tenuissimus]|nr:hypothetical protein PM082_018346 [Marasmius tenuissimus]